MDNLVLFFWDDPVPSLKAKTLSVSYFPDKGNKSKLTGIIEKDGRVFVDGEPFPKFGR